jgi:hypothetical protein
VSRTANEGRAGDMPPRGAGRPEPITGGQLGALLLARQSTLRSGCSGTEQGEHDALGALARSIQSKVRRYLKT